MSVAFDPCIFDDFLEDFNTSEDNWTSNDDFDDFDSFSCSAKVLVNFTGRNKIKSKRIKPYNYVAKLSRVLKRDV
jgi:hypothetical protein